MWNIFTNSKSKGFNFRRVFTAVFARVVVAFGSVLLTIVIAKYTDLEVLGAFAVLTTICSSAVIFARGGYETAYLREGSRMYDQWSLEMHKALYRLVRIRVFRRAIVISVVCAVICVLYVQTVTSFSVLDVILLSSSVITLSTLALSAEYFKTKSRADLAIILSQGVVSLVTSCILYAVLSSGIKLPFKVSKEFLISLIYAISCLAVLMAGIISIKFERNAERIGSASNEKEQVSSRSEFTSLEVINKSRKDFLLSQLYTFFSFGGLFLVASLIFDASDIGLIRFAERIAAPVALVLSVISPLISAKIARLYYIGKTDELVLLVRKIGFLCSALAVLLVVLGISAVPYFSNYLNIPMSELLPIMTILLIGNAINLGFGPLGMVLSMTRHEKKLKEISSINLFVALMLSLVLGSYFGTVGFSLALAVSYLIKNVLMYRVYKLNISIGT